MSVSDRNEIRVIHIVENLNGQAVESGLLRVLRVAADQFPYVRWTFFCVLGVPGRFDETARNLGAEVIHSPYPIGDKINFTRALRRTLKEGQYDVLHAHHDIMSAAYLLASVGLPIKKRIVHLHNTSMSLPTPSKAKARIVREPMRQICLLLADQVVGISTDALESMIGKRRIPKRDVIVHYAMDTECFAGEQTESESIRDDLQIPKSAKVLLFVGRMVGYKNPLFVVEVLEQLRRKNPQFVALFAGEGDHEQLVRLSAREKNLESHIRLLGFRNDIPKLMRAADLLIWPSQEEPREGLGLGTLEAQSAGLPILMSKSVPEEAIVVPQLVDVLPLAAGPHAWADRADEILKRPSFTRQAAAQMMERSSFSLYTGVRNFIALYEEL